MKRFIFTVVLLCIVCTLLSDEAMGSRSKRGPNTDECPAPACQPCEGPGLGGCTGGKICCFNGCGYECLLPKKEVFKGWRRR